MLSLAKAQGDRRALAGQAGKAGEHPAEENERLCRHVSELHQLKEQTTALTARINALHGSWSWTVTRPLRTVTRPLRLALRAWRGY
jgi:hypothetical protein